MSTSLITSAVPAHGGSQPSRRLTFPDHFSDRAGGYAEHRPRYPRTVAELLARAAFPSGGPAPAPAGTIWEAGCGSGQLSTVLGDCFARVIATDASEAQLARAAPHPRVEYRCVPAEASGLPDDSADAAVAAQAMHWFDFPRYNDEVRRVVRPGGIVALVSYGVMHTGTPVDELIAELHDRVLAPFWAPERRHILDGYRSIAFPFEELPVPPLEMEAQWTSDRLLGYVETWSAVRAMERAEGRRAIDAFTARLRERWGAPGEVRTVRWPLGIRLGRVRG